MLENMSLEVANEWEVLIGEGPSIICEARATNLDGFIENLRSETFQKNRAILKRFIKNYESRILTPHICKDLGYKAAYYSILSV